MTAEGFDRLTSGVKNCSHIFVVLFLVLGLLTGWVQARSAEALTLLQKGGVESLEVKGLKLKLRQAETGIQTLVNNPQALAEVPKHAPAPRDNAPSQPVGSALRAVDEPGLFWVYLGQFR